MTKKKFKEFKHPAFYLLPDYSQNMKKHTKTKVYTPTTTLTKEVEERLFQLCCLANNEETQLRAIELWFKTRSTYLAPSRK